MKSLFPFLVTVVLLLTGHNQPIETDPINGGGGTTEAINHTHWVINHLSVSDQSGIDIIGPWQGNGGVGYFGVPPKWKSGTTAKIDWETGVGDMDGSPGLGDDEKLLNWYRKMKLLNRGHSLMILVPDYNNRKACGIKMHFLPYDKIKVTTSYYDYDDPNYPVKDLVKMEEPEVCPE